jgi:hypothetical protein
MSALAASRLASSFAIGVVGTLLCAAATSGAQATATTAPCREERQFTASDYWFWHAYLGVEQTSRGGVVRGHLKLDPGVCFTIAESELAKSVEHSFGVKRAVAEWLIRLTRDRDRWTSDEAMFSRRPIERLIGREFGSYAELRRWWEQNRDYLVWSDAAGHLVIDEEAKRTKTPIASLTPVQAISAETYWFYQGMGWVRTQTVEGNDLKADTWTGDHVRTIRVPKADVDVPATKLAGYRHAVEDIIVNRLTIPGIGDESRERLINRLKVLTDQAFSDTKSWTTWWNANRDRLRLSPDGQRLIAAAA